MSCVEDSDNPEDHDLELYTIPGNRLAQDNKQGEKCSECGKIFELTSTGLKPLR